MIGVRAFVFTKGAPAQPVTSSLISKQRSLISSLNSLFGPQKVPVLLRKELRCMSLI